VAGSMKKVFIIGNLGSDPEVRFMPDGTPVTSFSVAVNERPRRGQDGGQEGQGAAAEEQTTWFRVSAWRRQGEIANEYLKKGMSVFISGDLRIREYLGKNDGKTHYALDVTMQDMQILTPKGVQEGAGGFDEGGGGGFSTPQPSQPSRPSASYGNRPAGNAGRPQASRPPAEPSFGDDDEGDIPF
jgi:single-strand DNA-binding protein